MYRNFYTTKMCTGKRVIEKRFRNIQSAKPIRGAAAVMGIIAAMIILTASVFASGAADKIVNDNNGIEVSYKGKDVTLWNKPFIDNYEVYLPLREVLNACGVANENITYDNGKINITLHSDAVGEDINAEIIVGEGGVKFDADRDNYMVNNYSNGKRTTSHQVILKNGTTYAPMGVFRRIKDYSVDMGEEYYDDFRYSAATRFMLLNGLEVTKHYSDGQFDVILSRELDVKGEDKYDPETYYAKGERVIIGTPEEQNDLWPEYNNVNGYYYPYDPIKRIIVDGEGKAVAIVLVQNQYHETLDRDDMDSWGAGNSGFDALSGEWPSGSLGVPRKNDDGTLTGEYDWYSSNSIAGKGRIALDGKERSELYFYIPTYLMVQPY